jgi:hypothetical protein
MKQNEPRSASWSIVAPDRFVRATRDSGYNSTASALSELVDNSIQAGANKVQIQIESDSHSNISVNVVDDGCGMDVFTLRQALRFGGSSRFNDRSGLGRFGMGLPNSSLSQARRVVVSSWTNNRITQRRKVFGDGSVLQSYLDVDEIASGKMVRVPKPEIPKELRIKPTSPSGTIVQWRNCDRLDFKRPSTISRHVIRELAQRFRFFIIGGVKIFVNGQVVQAFDPLFLYKGSPIGRAKFYGEEITYNIAADPCDPSAGTGMVKVRFSELPVQEWAHLSNKEKRQRGITNRAGASIVRSGREVDYGWHFFGSKRKENYDDWWRCEVRFDPILDEAFGVTHTKQQIRPKRFLVDILAPDLEHTARVLNGRARNAHSDLRRDVNPRISELIAREKSKYLAPIRGRAEVAGKSRSPVYVIEEKPLADGCFYSFRNERGGFYLTLDPDHAFFREIYQPLRLSDNKDSEKLRVLLELLLIAAARSEARVGPEDADAIAKFRADWGMASETFIGG